MQSLRARSTLRPQPGLQCQVASRPAALPRLSKTRVQAAASAPPNHAELVEAARKLADLARHKADQAELDKQADLITQLSAGAGTNKVHPGNQGGTFKGFTLTGRTADRFRTVITLGMMSFNKYQPIDTMCRMMDSDSGSVYFGPDGDIPNAYVVTAPFELVEADKVGEDATAAQATGIKGLHKVVGEYQQAPDNPQRLNIFFKKTRMQPAGNSPEDLQRWLDTFLPHNPTMDPKTGVLEVEMPGNSPEGWLDHVMSIPEYTLLQGNYGSRTLLQRVN